MTEENQCEYVRASDFFVEATEVSIGEDVQRDLRNRRRQVLLDESVVRQQEDWSILADQVVGREDRNRLLSR